MANVQHIFSGSGAPLTTPSGLGHHYINTDNDDTYTSINILSADDWLRLAKIFKGAGVPSSTPLAVGDMYIDETNNLPYTAVHTTDATGWSLGGGGGSSGPESDDFADYTFVPDGTDQTITIDATKKVHRIDVEALDNTLGGTLLIVLPNSTDLAGVDYSKDVQFKIFLRHSYTTTGVYFDQLSAIRIKVNGSSAYWNGSDIESATLEFLQMNGFHTYSNNASNWLFNDVRSTLIFDVQLRKAGEYTVIATRDYKAPVGE